MSFVASGVPARLRALGFLIVLAALARCTTGTEPGDPPPNGPGAVTYRLVSPNGVEGAFLFSLPADQVVSVPEGDFLTEVITRTVAGALYVAVVHRFGDEGLSLEVEVTDVDDPPEPTLLEVAGPDDRPRTLGGYAVEVES